MINLKPAPWALLSLLILLELTSALGNSNKTPIHQLPVGGTLPNGGKIWALLVAGSNDYMNYRHQADVCHAYQILHQNGIPKENIIVMMYDDIARSPENPTPNVIINRPGGPNVYDGVPIDYSSNDVNSTNFLAVLMGSEDAVSGIGSGRVIQSGPKDHIFVNFVDHGAPGFLCFPNDELHATQFLNSLSSMNAANKFSKMVMYIEACESGSMFDALLQDNSNIFVMTAADPRESSFACYFDKLRGTYLGDVFSVKWMEDSENENLANISLHHQFEKVRTETNTSHVEEYGDLDIGSLPVAQFQGYQSGGLAGKRGIELPPIEDAVSSRDVFLESLKMQYEMTMDRKTKRQVQLKINRLEKLRRLVDNVVSDIVTHISKGDSSAEKELTGSDYSLTADNLECYEKVVQHFSSKCFKISANPYVLSKMSIFINACSLTGKTSEDAIRAMNIVCAQRLPLVGSH